MADPLQAEDILLGIANGASDRFALDPIRLMKGAFLAWQQGPTEWHELFDFQPYDYGPFDSRIYGARDTLIRDGALIVTRHGRYDRYTITERGRARVSELRASQAAAVEWLGSIGDYVTTRSFNDLLREIYAAFPEFATRSVVGH